jgi:ABC-type dipeptide/oligopeptide/nickel transport system permease component
MTLPGTYIARRLLIALPSLLGISIVLFTVLALAPGDPFGELASNPNIPAEVRCQSAAEIRDGRPGADSLYALAYRDAAGRLGLFVCQPDQRRAR